MNGSFITLCRNVKLGDVLSSLRNTGHVQARMNPHTGNHRVLGLSWLSFAVAVLVLASPLKLAWARPALGWMFPFLLWGVIIALGAVAARAARDDEPKA